MGAEAWGQRVLTEGKSDAWSSAPHSNQCILAQFRLVVTEITEEAQEALLFPSKIFTQAFLGSSGSTINTVATRLQ